MLPLNPLPPWTRLPPWTLLPPLTLLLGVLLACQPDEGEALFETGFIERCAREATEALAQGADIHLPRPVPIVLLSADEAAERRAAYALSLGDEAGFTASMDVMADLMFSETMLGRYLPDEQVIYVIEDVLLDVSRGDPDDAAESLFPLLAHELVHAYDDMLFDAVPAPSDLEALLSDPSGLPRIQTLMALLEGRATYASELACAWAGRKPLPSPTLESARNARILWSDGSVAGDAIAGVGNAVARLKMIQYAQGRLFAAAAYAYGGEAFFGQVFTHLPLGMDELEDFHLFVVRWAEEVEAQLELDELGGDGPAEATDDVDEPTGG